MLKRTCFTIAALLSGLVSTAAIAEDNGETQTE